MPQYLDVPVKMHYIITLQLPLADRAGWTTGTYSGWRDVARGEKRGEVFAELYERWSAVLRRAQKLAGETSVLFFALEPDRLEVR